LLVKLNILTSIRSRHYWGIFRQNFQLLILPFYAILSTAWAIVPANAAITGGKLTGYIGAAIFVVIVVDRLSVAERRSVLIWAATGFIIAEIFVLVDLGTSGGIFALFRQGPFTANDYSRGAAISACAALPIAIGLFQASGARLMFVFMGFCVATVLSLDNYAAKLAVVLGLLVYVAVRWRRGLFWPVILLPLAAGFVSPIFFANGLNDSMLCTIWYSKIGKFGGSSTAHRLKIYEFSSRKISQRPLLGWGMDASRSIPGGDKRAKIYDCRQNGEITTINLGGFVPLHPHNASLQVWLELGAVGAVERDAVLNGGEIEAGDVVLGLASTGIHSNGFSLVRKIVDDLELDYNAPTLFDNEQLGTTLLKPTKIYVRSCLAAHKAGLIRGLAHITGGGLLDNIPRVLPEGLGVYLDAALWPLPPVIRWLGDAGRLSAQEMARTFNCGIGMVVITAPKQVDDALEIFSKAGETAYRIGSVQALTDQAAARVNVVGATTAWRG
ncbi:AIR synthase-related protein, partial [Alphaproteobacteria bacterium]|nr:AIR synthase-related protein [Alphaproteobacteria bacterium]